MPLAGTETSLYGLDGQHILRIDASTGRVLATGPYPTGVGSAVIGGGIVWLVPQSASNGSLTLQGFDPTTLAPAASINVSAPGGADDSVALAADAAGDLLYVAVGDEITVVNPTSRRTLAEYATAGEPVVDLAVAPDRSRLYVTWDIAGANMFSLVALDPATGRRLAGPIHYQGGTSAGSITASAGGIWMETGVGMTTDISFHPASDLASTVGDPVTYAGGGFWATSTLANNVVWVAGTTNLACADPATGAVRVSSPLPVLDSDAANITAITAAGHALFGYYRADSGPSQLLIRLSPPGRCDG